MRTSRLVHKVVFLLLLILPASHAVSQETLKLGSMDGFPPYNYYGKDGTYTGIDVAIIETILGEMGFKAEHVPRPWKRAVVDFERGHTDLLFQLTPKPERFEKWNMVGPIRNNQRVFLVLKESGLADIETMNDLSGLAVGTNRGFIYPDEFVNAQNFHVDVAKDTKANLRKLIARRVDIIVANPYPVIYYASELKVRDKIRFLPTPLSTEPRFVAFHKSTRGNELAARFQKILDDLRKSGRIEVIINKWLEERLPAVE